MAWLRSSLSEFTLCLTFLLLLFWTMYLYWVMYHILALLSLYLPIFQLWSFYASSSCVAQVDVKL